MPSLKVSKAEARQQLELQFTRGVQLSKQPVNSVDFVWVLNESAENWRNYTLAVCENLLVEESTYKDLFQGSGMWVISPDADLDFYLHQLSTDFRRDLGRLRNLINKLELYSAPKESMDDGASYDLAKAIASRKVFVVHGHNHGTRETVARFLDRLKFDTIILDEQPGQGRTLIEKFEAYSDVGYAVVLLTPDDEGRSKAKKEDMKDRARQNVLFELGYFAAKLSRGRV